MQFRFDEDDAIEELVDDLFLAGLERLRDLGQENLRFLVHSGLGYLSLSRVLCFVLLEILLLGLFVFLNLLIGLCSRFFQLLYPILSSLLDDLCRVLLRFQECLNALGALRGLE